MTKTFLGFGFGPIQSGLFLYEAAKSGNFDRLVVAEIAEDMVGGLRRSAGRYSINIAESDRVRSQVIDGVEAYNPTAAADRAPLVAAIAESTEIATALPAVPFYTQGSPSTAELLAAGLVRKSGAPDSSPMESSPTDSQPTLIYTAENHNRAAEILRDAVRAAVPPRQRPWFDEHVQFVNTVIGKMSGVVTDPAEIAQARLRPLVEGGNQAVLVEAFNHILIERVRLPNFVRGLQVFEEKANLLPFEEAKLYGHNAAHALLGLLAHRRGLRFMSDARQEDLMEVVEDAFLNESGTALGERYRNADPLFTRAGWAAYVADLLPRMTNPYLRDQVSRVVRDPARKLGWDDRLIGTMRLAVRHSVTPRRYAVGAAAALAMLSNGQGETVALDKLQRCWANSGGAAAEQELVATLVMQAMAELP